jgi:predicted MFS family arabinose efflux permease
VFWVIGHVLNEAVGWRQTLVVFAVVNLVICLPLHWLGLARRESTGHGAPPAGSTTASPDGPPLEGHTRSVAIALFALIMSLNGFVFGVISVQMVPLLEAAGLATAAAVWVASLKGVAQFGGRVAEIAFARNLRAMTVGRIAVGILPPSLLLLLAGTGSLPLVVAFTLLMGAFAWIVDRWGWNVGRASLLAGCSAAWLAMEVMSRWYERRRAAVAVEADPPPRP